MRVVAPIKKQIIMSFLSLIFFIKGGGTIRGLGTYHVISGPIRGLEKNCIQWLKQTDRTTHGQTWQLYDLIGPVGPIQ